MASKNAIVRCSKICKYILSVITSGIFNSPHYKAETSEFDNKSNGYSISTGKCWTLKMSKEDETTPGPIYDT